MWTIFELPRGVRKGGNARQRADTNPEIANRYVVLKLILMILIKRLEEVIVLC